MAGLGRKVWGRETLSAANLQGYLQDQTVMCFASASARGAAIAAPTEGMVSYLADVDRLDWYNGSTWSPVLPRGVTRQGSPGATIVASGSNETGITGGNAALANWTTYRPGLWLANYTFRASGAGVASCTVKVDGAQVGDVLVSRSDEHVSGHGTVAITGAGSHSVAARVDVNAGGSAFWSTFRITLQELMAE